MTTPSPVADETLPDLDPQSLSLSPWLLSSSGSMTAESMLQDASSTIATGTGAPACSRSQSAADGDDLEDQDLMIRSAPFPEKIYRLLESGRFTDCLQWSADGQQFIVFPQNPSTFNAATSESCSHSTPSTVLDMASTPTLAITQGTSDDNLFTRRILRQYFNHSKFQSFTRIMSQYGFHRSTSDIKTVIASGLLAGGIPEGRQAEEKVLVVRHEKFRRGQDLLLNLICRRVTSLGAPDTTQDTSYRSSGVAAGTGGGGGGCPTGSASTPLRHPLGLTGVVPLHPRPSNHTTTYLPSILPSSSVSTSQPPILPSRPLYRRTHPHATPEQPNDHPLPTKQQQHHYKPYMKSKYQDARNPSLWWTQVNSPTEMDSMQALERQALAIDVHLLEQQAWQDFSQLQSMQQQLNAFRQQHHQFTLDEYRSRESMMIHLLRQLFPVPSAS